MLLLGILVICFCTKSTVSSTSRTADLPNDTLIITHFDENSTLALKIGVIFEQPFSSRCALSDKCRARGYAVDAAIYMCRLMRINCTFEWYQSQNYGLRTETGNWTGMLNAISVGRFDTSLPIFTPNPSRDQFIGFSEPYFYTDVFLITRMPHGLVGHGQIRTLAIFKSFEWPVWCSFAAAFLGVSVLIVSARTVANGHDSDDHRRITRTEMGRLVSTTGEAMLRLVSGERQKASNGAHRMAILLWGLLTLVVSSTFTSVMFSERVTIRHRLPFSSISTFISCIERKQCKIVEATLSHSTVQYFVNESLYSSRLRRALVKNPIDIVPDDQIGARILDERHIYLTAIAPRPSFTRITDDNRGCRFYAMNAKLREHYGFPLRKDSIKIRKSLDRTAAQFRDLGMASALESRYGLNDNACPREHVVFSANRGKAIDFKSVEGMVWFYSIGTVFGILWYFMELRVWTKRAKREGRPTRFYVKYSRS